MSHKIIMEVAMRLHAVTGIPLEKIVALCKKAYKNGMDDIALLEAVEALLFKIYMKKGEVL